MNTPPAPTQPLDLAESAAGEEDPGAAIDLPVTDSPSDPLAPAGAPGTGEALCPRCGGSGKLAGSPCPACLGTGKVTAAIGGA